MLLKIDHIHLKAITNYYKFDINLKKHTIMKKITFVLIALFIGATSFAQTITQNVITSAQLSFNASNNATGWVPTPATLLITIDGFVPNTSYTIFNQFKITDASGAQWGGGSFSITTDASGSGSNNMWMPGFFGGAVFDGTETTAFWNSNTTGPAGPVTANQTFPIDVNTLSVANFSLDTNVSVYPNPTTDTLTIETTQKFNSVNIYDLTGKVVKTFEGNTVLNVSSLQAGMYFLKTDTGNSAKFVKK